MQHSDMACSAYTGSIWTSWHGGASIGSYTLGTIHDSFEFLHQLRLLPVSTCVQGQAVRVRQLYIRWLLFMLLLVVCGRAVVPVNVFPP